MEVSDNGRLFRPHFFTVNGTEYCVFSHIILRTPAALLRLDGHGELGDVLVELLLLEVDPGELVGLLLIHLVGDTPLARLLVDDELRGAVLGGDGEQRIRAGGERVAADLDRLLGREQGGLVGAGAQTSP